MDKSDTDVAIGLSLKHIREMSEKIEAMQDLVAYGDALEFIKPFRSSKGERIGTR